MAFTAPPALTPPFHVSLSDLPSVLGTPSDPSMADRGPIDPLLVVPCCPHSPVTPSSHGLVPINLLLRDGGTLEEMQQEKDRKELTHSRKS